VTEPIPRLNAALEGRYRIERELGEGGMATVYVAEDLRHHRRVAVKVLRPELAAVVGAERFLAEIETTANLQHPHILPLFDSGEADGFLFYVMPHVEGEGLRERLDRERQLPVEEAVRIVADLAEALDYAHRHGVIHRDIKPGNVLLHEGRPLIADFGIALAVNAGGGHRLTETGLSLGTPHYMSPEQATGDEGVGPATDIYALGCVAYEMLIGEPPYTGSTPQAVLGKIITKEPEPVREHRKAVPGNVDAAIRRALEKLPADRFASAKGFASALADPTFRHGEPARTRAFASEAVWNPVSVGATALAALFGGMWLFGRAVPDNPTARLEVARFTVSPPEGTTLSTSQGFAITPDGGALLIRASGGLHRRDLGGLESVLIPGTQSAWMPFVSPSGEWIAFFDTRESVLKRVRLDGSGLQTLGEAPSSVRSGAWSEDGTIVFYSTGLGGLARIRETGGESEPVDTDASAVVWLDLLPGGRTVLGGVSPSSNLDDQVVGLVSIETGQVTPLFPGTMPRFASGHIVYWRRGQLWAVPFDPDRLVVTGEHGLLASGVDAGQNGLASFVLSDGVLVYRPGTVRTLGHGMPVWVDRGGNEEALAIEPGLYSWPRISPNGRRVALTRLQESEDVWVHDLESGVSLPLTTSPATDATPVWTPDGERVIFRSTRDGASNLYSRRADGSDEVQRLTDSPTDQRPIAFTPGGALLFEEFDVVSFFEGQDIWSLGMQPDAVPARLLGDDYAVSAPTVSPDGRFIAYQSSERGYPEIFVRSFPDLVGARMMSTLDVGQQTSAANADPREARAPVWSRDGREILYQSGSAVVSVPVSTEGTFTVGAPRIAFQSAGWPLAGEGRHYDMHPDGQRVLRIRVGATEDAAGPANELVVVLNWLELLLQREGN